MCTNYKRHTAERIENMKKGPVKFVILVLIIFIMYNMAGLISPDIKTQVVSSGSLEKVYSLDGVIIRDETTMSAGEAGVFEAKVKEGEIVKKNKLVASVYKGEVDNQTQNRLEEINRRINEINAQTGTEHHSNDAYKLEQTITAKINDIIMASNDRDAEKVTTLKQNLSALATKRVSTGTKDESSSLLAELRAEKEQLEKSFSASKSDIYSPVHGQFSTNIDGYEGLMTNDAAFSMTVADYQLMKKNRLSKNDIEKSGVTCKIIDNYQWSVATLVNDSVASHLEKGKAVYVRFPHDNTEVAATISHISAEASNKYVVVITSTSNSEYAFGNREVEFDLVYQKYTGIKVPVKALSVSADGATGVYVLVNSAVQFKPVNVLYKDSKYAIVETATQSGGLLLYDEVITYAKDYTEGKKYE